MTVCPPNGLDDAEGHKATLPLSFIVVGAGLGGLVAAISLQDAGHSAIILDARAKEEVLSNSNGESFYIGPNIHRVLSRCGVELPQHETWQAGLTSMRRYANGEVLLHLTTPTKLHDECGGGEFYVASSTLLKYLYNRAIQLGVQVRFDSRVTSVIPYAPSVILDSGKILSADVIVGADGPFSVVREAIAGERELYTPENVDCVGEYISFRVERSVVLDDPDLLAFIEDEEDEVHIWLGPGAWVCSHPLRGSEEYAVVAYTACSKSNPCPIRRRQEIPMTDEVRARFAGFEPRIRKLFTLPQSFTSTHWRPAPPLESWIQEDGKLILIGDAAHPTQPTSIASTPSANLEDGAVLGGLYSHLRSRTQIPMLSQTYEDLRSERCRSALDLDLNLQQVGSLPDGPAQEARDYSFRLENEKFDKSNEETFFDPRFTTLWNQRLDVWKYDAWEDVADWWLRLGRIQQAMLDGPQAPISTRRLSVGVEKQVQIASEL